MCIVGVEKHWIEKDMIKYFRKTFNAGPVITTGAEESKEEPAVPCDEIPLKGVAKKRGKTFAFLQFTDLAEKTDFMDQFTTTIAPVKRFRLREVFNQKDVSKPFKPVKGTVEMA